MKVCPLAIGEDANELSSALTVWSVESSNFHVTVVPTGTVRLPGMNMKFMISTVDPPPAGAEPLVLIGRALLVTLKGGRGTVHVILSKSAGKHLRHLRKLGLDVRLIAHNAATVNPASTTVVSPFALGR